MSRVLKIGLVGAGMFGGDVHLRTYCQLQQNGILPWLGRLGLDNMARALGDIQIDFVALATNTPGSNVVSLIADSPPSRSPGSNGVESSAFCRQIPSGTLPPSALAGIPRPATQKFTASLTP